MFPNKLYKERQHEAYLKIHRQHPKSTGSMKHTPKYTDSMEYTPKYTDSMEHAPKYIGSNGKYQKIQQTGERGVGKVVTQVCYPSTV